MATHFEKAIETVLHHEGGYVNDPVDPGGPTSYGVSLRFLVDAGDLDKDGYLDGDIDKDGDVDVNDIKKMTREQAIKIYKLHFWDKNGLHAVKHYEVAEKLLDMCVNMGARQTGKIVQRACNYFANNLKVDGIMGPNTFKAVNSIDGDRLIKEIRYQHAKFYLSLIEEKPHFAKYRNGWLRRACS